MDIRIKRFDTGLNLPEQEHDAAAFDLVCRESVTIPAHTVGLVPINIAVEVPVGHFLLIAARSSTPLKKGLILANGIGIVDPFYNGDKDEIKVQLLNFTDDDVVVFRGELLTQAVLIKNEPVTWHEVDTFGHDGHGGYWT